MAGYILQKLAQFASCDNGVTAIEYSLIAAGTSLAIATLLSLMGDETTTTYTTIKGYFDTVLGE